MSFNLSKPSTSTALARFLATCNDFGWRMHTMRYEVVDGERLTVLEICPIEYRSGMRHHLAVAVSYSQSSNIMRGRFAWINDDTGEIAKYSHASATLPTRHADDSEGDDWYSILRPTLGRFHPGA